MIVDNLDYSILKAGVAQSVQGLRLRAGWFGVPIPVEARDSYHLQQVQTASTAHPTSCSIDTGVVFRGKSSRGVKLTPRLHLHSFKAWKDENLP